MKKLFILLFLTISFFVNGQSAKPTTEETLSYLKNYYSSILTPAMGESTIEYSSSLITLKSCINFNKSKNNCLESKSQNIIPKEITSIMLENIPFKKISDDTVQNAAWGLSIQSQNNKIYISINASEEKEKVEKLKKAITRLAELCGAKIINDDLFKN